MADVVTSVKDVFEKHMPQRLQSKPDVITKINSIYHFNISGAGGGAWVVDCTQPGGKIEAGSAPNAKCTVAATDQDFLAIVNGKLNPQMAFMSGKL
ncbi:MAG: SCP2 sterol-binding domain-containing protein, partial [Anaeromyxobacteraceae bacterium]